MEESCVLVEQAVILLPAIARDFILGRYARGRFHPRAVRTGGTHAVRSTNDIENELPQWHPLFAALAYTGARFGEASALKWEDIDFDAKTITVRRAQWGGTVDSTKTDHWRTIPLTPPLEAALKSSVLERSELPRIGRRTGWIFRTPKDTFHRSPSLRKPLLKALSLAGIDQPFTLHGFRHTWNNLLRQAASGEVVRSITGHVTTEMTEHYSHISSEEKSKAANAVLKLLKWDQSG